MNNVLAVGGCVPTLSLNSNTPAPGLLTKPPSPTAVAINLLNLLKIANTMSHPMYNPFAPGKQGPYGLSGGQMEMDPRRPPPHFGSGSSFSSAGSSGLNRGPSGGPIPSILSLPGNYRAERNKITVDEDIDRCLDLNISRAREEVMQTSSSQNTQFTNVQRDTFPSSNKGIPSYLTSPASQVNRSFTVDSSSSSLDWLPICQSASVGESSKKYSSASSSFLSSGDGLFSTSSEGKHMSSIPGLGDYDMKRPAKSAPPPEPIRHKYTSESASNILLHFGLEKEDLEHLISYPEDQITPENLPFILRQIKLEKEKKAATAVQSKPYGATQPNRSMGEKDKLITSRGPVFDPDQISSTVLKPSKVIDYGHTGKYTTGVGNEVGRTIGSSTVSGASGSLLSTDTFKPSSHVREPPQRGQLEMKTGSSVSSHGKMSSVSSVDSLRNSVAPSSSDPSKKLGVQTNQTKASVFPSFGLLNKDTELRRLKSKVPQTPPLKQPELARQAPPQTQQSNPPCNLSRGVHPGRPGLVLIHSNISHSNNQSKTQGQGLKAPEQVNKQPAQQQSVQQTLQHQAPLPLKPQMHLQPIQPLTQVQQQGRPAAMPPSLALFPIRPPLPTPAPVPIRSSLPTSAPVPIRSSLPTSAPVPVCPSLPTSAPVPVRPSLPTPAPGRMDAMPHMPPPVFKDQTSVAKMGPSKLPTLAMMQDYAAATPRIFPHTCCLCMKECTDMKDWLSHQNTSLHLDSCRLLRLRYPEWDGTTLELLSGPGKGTQPSPTTPGQNFHETRSHSLSPHRQHGSEDRKESPHHHYGSESRRQKHSSRSRSRSPQRHHSSEGQRERRSSRSPHTSRHSRRSRSRSYDRPTSSHHRSRSRSYERRSPPRKREAKRSSPRRSYEHRSSPRRSHETRSPAERSAPQRKRSRSADRLAKRLLETTAVHSLSKQSDLEAMVKTLAPALLAELAKMKSSSFTSTEKKTSSTKPSKATSSRPKSGTSASTKPTSTESSHPNRVRLCGVPVSVSHDDLFGAMAKFGKVRQVIIIRSALQAIIHFEKRADAEKLKKLQCFQVKGINVYVDKKPSAASKKPQSEQKEASQKKPAGSSTKSTPTGKNKTPALSGAKNTTTSKLVTKAKGVPAKAVGVKKPSAAGKSAVKIKTEASGVQKPKSPVKTPSAGDSKDKGTNTTPESDDLKSADIPSESDTAVGDGDKGEKDLTPEAKTSSNTVKAKGQPDAPGVKDLVSKSAHSENQPVAVKAEGEQPHLVTKIVDTVEASEKKQAEECVKVDAVRVKAEDVEPGKTGPAEPMEVVSSAESKDRVSETLKPAARVKTPPCSSSPPKTSADPPQTLQTTVKAEEASVEDSSQAQPRAAEESESPAEKLNTETEQQQSSVKTETKPEDVSSHLTPEPVSNVLAVKLEEPTSAETKPAEGAYPAAAADVSSLTIRGGKAGEKKMAKQEQHKEINRTPMKTVKSSMPLSEDSNNAKQPTLQTCASVSPSPAVLAELIPPGSVKAESTISDMKARKSKTELVAVPTVSRKSNENEEKKRSPEAPITTAEKQTMPAPSTSTMSVTAWGKPEENAAELPQIDEDFFKALTTALREHRKRKGEKNTSEENATISKITSERTEEENIPLTKDESKDEDNFSDPFDEFDFNFGDFVTVDEITEEMDDTAVEDTSFSLESISRDKTERQNPDVSSAASKTSTRSSKDCKSSASFSSTSEKESESLSSTSESENKQKPSSEPHKSETKTSPASDIKTSPFITSKSVETPPSSGQKSQSNKNKPPSRSSEPSSLGQRTCSLAAAIKSPVETQQVHKKDVKPTESAVAKSDHNVSVEGCAGNTVESELKIKPWEKNQPAEGKSSQIQNLKTDVKDETVKEMKKRESKEKIKDTDGKSTEEKRGNNENKQILDSLNEKSDEQKNKDSQDRRPEIQIPAPEQDQTIHQGGLLVVESADDDNARSDECQEMEADESTELQDGAPKDQAATGDGDGDEGTTMMQVSEKDETKEVQSSEGSSVRGTADRNQVTSEETNQTPNTCVVAVNVKQKDETLLSEDVCETSKEIGQTSKEEDHDDSKDTLKDQKLVVPTDLLSKADNEPTDEEVYEVIDSLEDGPTTTETESETEKKEQRKKESKTASRDVRPTRQGRSRSRTSKSEEKEKSPKQLDKAKYATQMKDSKTEKECLENFEEMVYEVVDSIEDDSVQETSTTGSSSRRRTARGNKKDEKTSPSVEEPTRSDKEEEEMFTVLDSVEEESPHDKPVVMRSTRGRRENTVKNVEENTKMKEDKTPTRRRHIPVRDSKEKGGAKTSKTDVLLKESAPTKKSAAAVTSTGEEDGTHEELDAVEDDQPTTQKTRRGRPKKDNKTSKKQTEEEPVYQIVDSLEEDQEETMTVASSLQKESETKAEMVPNVNTGLLTKMKGDKTPTRGIHTPARDSQEKDRIPLKESTPTKKSAAAVSSTVEEDGTSEKLDAVVDDQPTTQKPRRRHPPARDSQEKDRAKTPKTDVCVPLKERTPTNKSDARHLGEDETTYEVLDAVEEDLVKPTTQTSRRGRPKKDNKASKKQTDLKKVDSPRKVEEEEAAYQILDSVEDEVVDDRAPIDQSESASALGTSADDDIAKEIIRSLLNEEEGEMLYQIVDSLEEDQVQEETMTETSMQKESETTEDTVAGTDHILSSPSTAELSEQTDGGDKTLPRLAGKPLVDKEDPSAKGSDTEKKGSTSKADVGREDESLNKPNSHLGASEKNMLKSPKRKGTKATKNVLVNLDQVSEEEEDYPDDAAEEELLKKRQAAAKKRENDRGERKSRERKTREQRSQSSSRGESEKLTSETEKTTQEDLEKVEVDTQDLVTLDEVGEDEVEEEAVTEAPAWDGELTEGELQDLVTLDEIIEEEEGKIEAPPQSQESQIVDFLKLETLSALTETAWIEDKKDDDPKEPSSLPKRKHDDTTEESGNFVTVDELGEIEEEEGKEAVTTRSRPRKRSRQTPVRKSTRGKTVKEEPYGREEGDKSLPPASLDSSSTLDTSGATGDVQLESERMEEEKNTGAASAEHQPLPNDGLKLGSEEAEKQMHSRAVVKVIDKRKQELMGPDAKRFRSQSPSVPVALQLPPFNPKNPLGKEFVNPTSGFFCSLCSVFYRNEDTAKEIHCSSREHYDNLKNHYQRLHQGVQSSLTD
ncbi:uncharacterized protein FYW61_019291 [Anableps anableps]